MELKNGAKRGKTGQNGAKRDQTNASCPVFPRLPASCPIEQDWVQKGSLVISPGTVVREPIRVNLHGTGASPLRIEIGAGSSATVVGSGICRGCKRVDSDMRIDIEVGDGARLDFHAIGQCAAGGRAVSRVKVSVGRGAIFRLVDGRLGGGEISSSVRVELIGECAEADLKTLFYGGDSDRLELDYRVEHFASGATSRIMTRGALGDDARVAYRVRTEIARGLSGCSGHERVDALLLSRGARFDCSPELGIDSDDVRCGHGMSVSGLDEHRLFYLMSRGLDRVSAIEAAAKGFMDPVLRGISDGTLRGVTESLLTARLRCTLALDPK